MTSITQETATRKPIHPAQIKAAAKLGLEIREYQDGYAVSKAGTKRVFASAETAKAVLEAAKAKLAEIEAGEGEEDADEEDEETRTGSKVAQKYRDEYKARGDATCCGDDFSQQMRSLTTTTHEGRAVLDMASLTSLATSNGLDMGKYAHLNPGMQRMNVGNVLRGRLRRGETIQFNGKPRDAKYFGVKLDVE